jgi:subtilisin family serine protease
VVVSAGNDGPLCESITAPPSIYEQSFTVGAINEAGDLASFSSVGPVTIDDSGRTKPDVLAPGVDVLSAWPGGGYQLLSGTSMAGPHVAGAVALIWSANPKLRGDIERTRAILQETAHPFTGGLEVSGLAEELDVAEPNGPLAEMIAAEYERSCLAHTDLTVIPNNVAGYGVIDVYAAVQAALAQE